MTNLLPHIDQPSDLRALSRAQLPGLATELRQYVLESVARTGGHLSSNLGTVELTIALHYVFNTPEDRIVWDVGHQTYPHKILTGRRDRMHSLRQFGGISGFPKRDESEYDTFGTAHSSTSISAALGMAMAAHQKGEHRHAIAVIGDGAMTAGMAFEALNNAGVHDVPLLVVLNDNDMSISPPVGALNRYLAQLMSGQFYAAAKQVGKQVLKNAPPLFELAKRLEEHAKGMVVPATLFEKFGFNYVGPIDGHDLDSLIPTLENVKPPQGPAVPARGHQKRPRLQTGRGRPRGLPRPRQVRPRRGLGQTHSGSQKPRSRRCLAVGCATWLRRMHGWWPSPPPCAKARAWSSFTAASLSAITTWALPSSMPSRLPPAWRARG
jgi:1-deoxy-D-xylulose-5-phosphate synthase